MRVSLLLLFLVPVTALPTFAQCDDKNYSTTDMVKCLVAANQKADADLNSIYRKTLRALPAGDATLLRKAQRSWLIYRDAHCDAEYKLFAGGSIAPVNYGMCKLALTRRRSKEIEDTYTPIH